MIPASLDELLSAVSGQDGLPNLTTNDQGVCQFRVDDRLTITLEAIPQEPAAHLYTVLCHAGESGREDLFASLLEAHLFGRELGDGLAFGYDPATAEILLYRRLTAHEMSEEAFLAALSTFINWADHWSEKLTQGSDSTVPDQAMHQSLPLDHLIRA
jgi:hypothetical protein